MCGHMVLSDLAAARRLLGYCPQFSALPGAMTGWEVLRMYARLRGMPPGLIEGSVESLLERLDLLQFSNRWFPLPHPHFSPSVPPLAELKIDHQEKKFQVHVCSMTPPTGRKGNT